MTTQNLPKITLVSDDYPDAPLEVEVLASNMKAIRVVIPNTHVAFWLYRQDSGSLFRGSIGARDYHFDPGTIAKKAAPRARKAA